MSFSIQRTNWGFPALPRPPPPPQAAWRLCLGSRGPSLPASGHREGRAGPAPAQPSCSGPWGPRALLWAPPAALGSQGAEPKPEQTVPDGQPERAGPRLVALDQPPPPPRPGSSLPVLKSPKALPPQGLPAVSSGQPGGTQSESSLQGQQGPGPTRPGVQPGSVGPPGSR